MHTNQKLNHKFATPHNIEAHVYDGFIRLGCGFFWGEDLFITSHHVVGDMLKAVIRTIDGE